MNEKTKNLIVALDVGTTKVCTVVASFSSFHSDLEILGFSSYPGHGLKKGSVVDIEQTIQSIKHSLDEAKRLSKVSISSVNIGIAGGHIYSFNSSGTVAIKNHEITLTDIARAIEAAKAVVMPSDREIIHCIPQEFKVDAITGIKNPIGMKGTRLEVQVHIVTGSIPLIQNLLKCVEENHVEVENIILQPIASSMAVLSEEEKQLGVALIDIGGGTTDLAIWKDGGLLHSHIIPIGGQHFTNDLSIAFNIPYQEAERIKMEYGSVIPSKQNLTSHLLVKGLSGTRPREIKSNYIAEILGARAEELILRIKSIIKEKNLHNKIIGGYILTGGGALLKHLPELTEFILERPTKIGLPFSIGKTSHLLQNPKYATVVGLLLESYKSMQNKDPYVKKLHRKTDIIKRLSESLKNAFKEIF